MSKPLSDEVNTGTQDPKISLCPECGVPEEIAKNYVWLNSGVVVQGRNMSKRVSFIESENLDPLYRGIGRIIGMPIDNLVIDVARRHTVQYFSNLIQPEVRGMLRNKVLKLDFIVDFIASMGVLNGNGRYEIVDLRYEGDEDDYALIRIHEPFSVPLAVGINIGASEVVTEQPHKATYEEVSPGLYEVRAYVCQHDKELEDCLSIREYYHRDGDIELEICTSCGGPKGLRDFEWQFDRGMIINTLSGRRLKIIDPGVQDCLFEELERKVGDNVQHAVIEAQRRFTRAGFYSVEETSDEEGFRNQLALRGMGNLRDMNIKANGLRMRIDNAANYLMAVGLAQGLFEMANKAYSHVEWELSDKGDLVVEVTPHK